MSPPFLLVHDLVRPCFARRPAFAKPASAGEGRSGLRTRVRPLAGPSTGSGGKPVPNVRNRALAFQAGEAIERALQDVGGGVLVDYRRALLAADVGRDQLAFDGGGGQPLVPERDRPLRQFGKVAREGAG